jgi:hypothetical protein
MGIHVTLLPPEGYSSREIGIHVTTLNKQSRTADKWWFHSSGVGREVTAPHRIKAVCYEMLHRASGLDRFYGTTEARKIDVRCDTQNVKSLCTAG